MEISTAITAYAMRKDISEKVGYNIEMVMAEYQKDGDSLANEAMDFLQARVRYFLVGPCGQSLKNTLSN